MIRIKSIQRHCSRTKQEVTQHYDSSSRSWIDGDWPSIILNSRRKFFYCALYSLLLRTEARLLNYALRLSGMYIQEFPSVQKLWRKVDTVMCHDWCRYQEFENLVWNCWRAQILVCALSPSLQVSYISALRLRYPNYSIFIKENIGLLKCLYKESPS